MTPEQLESYLHEHMPLTDAMAVRVVAVGDDQVVLEAPLAPNRNHRGTVFGGSIASLAIAAGWSLVFHRLRSAGLSARIVIQRANVEYLTPIDSIFQAEARAPEPEDWDRFSSTFRRRGRARLGLTVIVRSSGVVGARVDGTFVALPGEESSP